MKKLRAFWAEHPDAEASLRAWYRLAKHAEWETFDSVRQTCSNSADKVGRCTVFNIRGNRYRLITHIDYEYQKVFIRFVLTHGEYDRAEWEKDC